MGLVDIVTNALAAVKRDGDEAEIAIVVKGAWPESGRKRLLGRKGGPFGRCMAEYEDAVLCLFKAREVLRCAAPLFPITRAEVVATALRSLPLGPS